MKRIFTLTLLLIVCNACKKIFDVGAPTDRTASVTVYENDATAASAFAGLYYTMSNGGPSAGADGLSYICGLSADEYQYLGNGLLDQSIYQNNLTSSDLLIWKQFYYLIYQANLALSGLTNSNNLTSGVKQQLMGEAYFVRAFCYHYLVNLFGDVPLLTDPDYKTSISAARTNKQQVYEQIEADLRTAIPLLSEVYMDKYVLNTSSDRVRPTKWAARALLARVSLYTGKWQNAVWEVDSILERRDLFDTVPLSKAFLKNSKEAIWQLQPVDQTYTMDGYLFSVTKPVAISEQLLSVFDKKDKRLREWLSKGTGNLYYPGKYKSTSTTSVPVEYLMVLRVGELYLIRSEASAYLGDLENANKDLNILRKRAGLNDLTANTLNDLINAIQKERRVELFSEWGHRWMDLKRSGNIDSIMNIAAVAKSSTWRSFQQLYPIPDSDLKGDTKLTQNPGY